MPKPNRRDELRGAMERSRAREAEDAQRATVHPIRRMMADEGLLLQLPVASIRPNPDQPRKHFNEAAHADLTASVKEKGVIQPVIVRRDPADRETCILIAGERRWRAAQAAGLADIPAIVRTGDDDREIALIENVQRENLSAIDEAEALAALKAERGYTDEQLAKVIGKSRVGVTETLTLTRLPDDVRAECRALDMGTRIQLLAVARAGSAEKMRGLWEALKSGEATTTRELQERVRASKPGKSRTPKHHQFTYAPDDRPYRVTVTFSKAHATPREVRAALKAASENVT